MSFKGIDLSTYQRNVNYLSLKADGIEFAIIRAGFGKNESQKDDMLENHYAGFRYVNIPIGFYHYSYVNSEENALLEAKNCLKFIKDKKCELPVFLDLEEKLIKAFGKEQITNFALIFCREIKKAGFKAGVYANLDWFKNYVDFKKIKEEGFYIWLAQWNNKPDLEITPDFWQYTSKGKVHGIEGNVDLDICYLDNLNCNKEEPVNNVEKPVDNSNYEVGKTYLTLVDLNVRTGAGTENSIKKYNELTIDGKKHAYIQNYACLKKQTKVTCLEVINKENEIWIRIPSGWIACYYHGKIYVE